MKHTPAISKSEWTKVLDIKQLSDLVRSYPDIQLPPSIVGATLTGRPGQPIRIHFDCIATEPLIDAINQLGFASIQLAKGSDRYPAHVLDFIRSSCGVEPKPDSSVHWVPVSGLRRMEDRLCHSR